MVGRIQDTVLKFQDYQTFQNTQHYCLIEVTYIQGSTGYKQNSKNAPSSCICSGLSITSTRIAVMRVLLSTVQTQKFPTTDKHSTSRGQLFKEEHKVYFDSIH